MAYDVAKMDGNSRQTLTAISNVDGVTVVPLYADPTTHRLLVDSLTSGTVTSVATGTGLTGGPITSTGTIALAVALQPMATLTGNGSKFLRVNAGETAVEYATISGTGTVTDMSIVSANGFAGTVATSTTTPAVTLTTTVTGILKGNGTAMSAATAGSDYAVGSTGLAGGQTIAGGTLTTQNLTLRANAADTTTGSVAITTSTTSSSKTTGALTVAGGVGVSGAIFSNDLTVTNAIAGSITGNAATVTVADAGGDTTTFPMLATAATGNIAPATDAGLTYNATSNRLGVTGGAELGTAVATIGADATLDVFGTTNAIFHGHNSGAQSTTGGAAIIGYAVPGAAITTGNRLGAFVLGGDVDASHTLANATAITSFATENWSGTQNGSNIKLEVTQNGATTRTTALTVGQDLSTTFAGTAILGTNSITMTGSIAATGARVTKGWFTDIESTNMPTVGGTAILTSLTAPQFTTIELGHATDTTLSRVSAGVVAIEGANIMTVSSADTVTGTKSLSGTAEIKLGTAVTDKNQITLNSSALNDETWSGTVIEAVAGATLAVGDVCYLKTADGQWYLNDGILDGTDAGFKLKLGICVLAANDNGATKMLLDGVIASAAFPTFTVGAPVYLDDTAGDLTVTQPTTTNFAIRVVGEAVSATVLHFHPSNDYIVHV